MAEAADELSAPLGREITRGRRRFRLPFTIMQVLATALGGFLLAFAGYALFNDDPFGGSCWCGSPSDLHRARQAGREDGA